MMGDGRFLGLHKGRDDMRDRALISQILTREKVTQSVTIISGGQAICIY